MDQINSSNPTPLYFAAPTEWYTHVIPLDALPLAHEQIFERQTLRNRLYYGSFQGTKFYSIPLVHSSLNNTYQKVRIDYSEHWQNHLINAIQTSYGKSPFYEYYGYRFESIIRLGHELLWDFNLAILNETFNCLKINIPLTLVTVEKAIFNQESTDIQYYQVFQERINFQPNLSILDLIFNEGPDAYDILLKTNKMNLHK